jgi:hypothetical protein
MHSYPSGKRAFAHKRWIMVKKTEFISERPMIGGVTDHAPRVIRVRRETWRGGSRYAMNHWLIVPAWMRRLDGVTVVRLVLLALLALAGVYGLVRVVLRSK